MYIYICIYTHTHACIQTHTITCQMIDKQIFYRKNLFTINAYQVDIIGKCVYNKLN